MSFPFPRFTKNPALAFLACAAVFIALRGFVAPNANIAWLMTVADRLLDGQRLYVDVVETNPPFSIYLYLPAAALARLTGWQAEAIFDAMVVIGAAAAMIFCARLLRETSWLRSQNPTLLGLATSAVLLVLPAACFGEREHVALIACLPVLCLVSARAAGVTPSLGQIVAGGLCGGLMLVIKPHFVLALAPMAALGARAAQRWAFLVLPEYVIAAVIALAYAGCVAWLHPQFYRDMMPLLALIYLPVRLGPLAFLWQFKDLVLAFCALLLLAFLRDTRRPADPVMLAVAAAIGFFIAVVVQGKGMAYHFYPAFALALLACFAATRAETGRGLQATKLLPAILFGVFWTWFNAGFDLRNLVAPVRAAALHPRVLALGYDFSAGPPVARAAGGVYVGRVASQWSADNVHWLLDSGAGEPHRAALEAIEQGDRALFVDDLITGEPDVLLVQRGPDDWMKWAERDPRFGHELERFTRGDRYLSTGMRIGVTLDYEVWTRHR